MIATVNANVSAAGTVTSFTTLALPAAIAANSKIVVSFGTDNAEVFTVANATQSLGATTINLAGSVTSAKAHSIGDTIRLQSTVAIPTTVYVALSTGTASQAVVEPVGNGYARVAVPNNPANWPAASGSAPASKSNGTTVTFPVVTGSGQTWGTVQSIAIYDDPTSTTNLLGQGNLTTNQVPNSGTQFSAAPSQLVVTLQ